VAMGNASQVDATAESRTQMAQHAQALTVAELLRVIQAFNQAATETRSSWQPALPLEMAFIEAISSEGKTTQKITSPVTPAAPAASPSPATEKPASSVNTMKETHHEPSESREMSPEDAITNQRLDKSWNLVLAQLRGQNSSLYALVNSVKSRSMKGNTLILSLGGEALKTRLEDPSKLELLQRILKQVMGKEIYVQVILTSGTKSTPPAEVDSDGMVASALRDLGGEIVDIQ
jgi:DNA polymerase III gamma/tau subunit